MKLSYVYINHRSYTRQKSKFLWGGGKHGKINSGNPMANPIRCWSPKRCHCKTHDWSCDDRFERGSTKKQSWPLVGGGLEDNVRKRGETNSWPQLCFRTVIPFTPCFYHFVVFCSLLYFAPCFYKKSCPHDSVLCYGAKRISRDPSCMEEVELHLSHYQAVHMSAPLPPD